MKLILTPDQRRRLSALTHVHDQTIRKYPNCLEASRLRIEEGCAKLGIPIPSADAQPAPLAARTG